MTMYINNPNSSLNNGNGLDTNKLFQLPVHVFQLPESSKPVQFLQQQQQPTTNYTLIAGALAALAIGAYVTYKYAWVPYRAKKEQEKCVESCYEKYGTVAK